MMRRVACVAVAVFAVAAVAFAGESMETKGKVKSVAGNTVTLTADDGTEISLEASTDSVIIAKGASHKMDDLDAQGKPSAITEFVKEKSSVSVKYADKDGKHMIEELRVH